MMVGTPKGKGLDSGRNWTDVPTSDGPIEWLLDPDQGWIQGPLDLEFLRGQKICLTLEENQIALLTQGNDLRAVFLDGAHYLDVGPGDGQVSPDGQMIFLATDQAISVRWTKKAPFVWQRSKDLAIIGLCELKVNGPAQFFRTFLSGGQTFDAGFLGRMLTRIANAALEGVLEAWCANPLEVQSRLPGLTPDILDEYLHHYGLECTNLAVYTATGPVEEYATETTGQLDEVTQY